MSSNPTPLRTRPGDGTFGRRESMWMHEAKHGLANTLESEVSLPVESQTAARPFARLRSGAGGPLKIGILSDFVRVPYANGAVFQTRTLYRSLRQCGHQVTVIGPHDPDARPEELAPGTIQVPSRPMKAYPGVHLPMPTSSWLFDTDRWDFDLVFGQTTSMLIELGIWLRKMKGIPLLCVNTTHLPAAYEVLLPNWLARVPGFRDGVDYFLRRPFESLFRDVYNESDGLVVLSEGLKSYWSSRGVHVPIHVIPRAVSRDVFERASGVDPYAPLLEAAGLPTRVPRLICAGRHTREKAQDRVIRIFAKHVLPSESDAVLFMIGTGPDSEYYRQLAVDLGVAGRVIFTGEVAFQEMPNFYRHADLFLHTSLSETFGNVLGEALWSGTAVVAMADGMGASAQVQDKINGILLHPNEPSAEQADRRFAGAVLTLLEDTLTRRRLGREAARIARARSSPEVIEQLTVDAFESAREHVQETVPVPAMQRSRWAQLSTTAKHAQRWGTVMAGVYVTGKLRPASAVPSRPAHPSIPR